MVAIFKGIGALSPAFLSSPSLQWIAQLVVQLIEGLLLVFVTLFVARSIKRRYFTKLYSIPGPFWASITRGWRIKEVYEGHMERTELELHRKYGPLIRTAPDEVIISDPAGLDILYGFGSKFPKTDFYRLFGLPDVYGVHVFSQLDPVLHAKMNRHIATAYSMTSILELEPYVDSAVECFMQCLHNLSIKRTPVNMAQWFQWYAFDVIGELTFSTRFGFMEQATDVENTIKTIDYFTYYVSFLGQAFPYHWLLLGNPLVKLFVGPPSNVISNFAAREIEARKGRPVDRRDMLSRFMLAHEKRPQEFDMDDLFRTCSMNVAAGSDTTGIALTATLYHLLKNPAAFARLQSEIDDASKSGKLSHPAKLNETKELPYLQAVVKESMRVHPSVSYILPRAVPEGGVTISGKFLPAGTRVGMNPYVLHRDKTIFGHDADIFRPERWLEADNNSAKIKQMDKYMLQFGAGSRICGGRHISILEMNKVIVELLRTFDIELVDPKCELETTNRWFLKPHGLPVYFRSRSQL